MPHTAGPWFAEMNEIVDMNGVTVAVARATLGDYDAKTAVHNAGLIAGTPGLFAALLHIADITKDRKMLTEREIRDVNNIAVTAIGKVLLGSDAPSVLKPKRFGKVRSLLARRGWT